MSTTSTVARSLDIEDAEIDWPQLLGAVKDAPDGEFVKVDAPTPRSR